jgi:hypothetical protein
MLFRVIRMLCRIDIIVRDIPHVQYECENIMQNNVNPVEHCYGSESCYACA